MKRTMTMTMTLAVLLLVPAAAGASEGGSGVPGPWELVFKAFNVGVLVALLVYLLRSTIGQLLRDRKEGIKKRLESAERERDEARKALQDIEARIASVKEQIETFAVQAEREGEELRTRIESRTVAEVDQIKNQTTRFVNERIVQAKKELKAFGARLAVEQAEAMLKERLTERERAALFDQSLSRLMESAQGDET